MTVHDVPPSSCPNCLRVTDQVTGLTTEGRAKEGDITVCLYCGNVNVFDVALQLRPITDPELASLRPEILIRIKLVTDSIEHRSI